MNGREIVFLHGLAEVKQKFIHLPSGPAGGGIYCECRLGLAVILQGIPIQLPIHECTCIYTD